MKKIPTTEDQFYVRIVKNIIFDSSYHYFNLKVCNFIKKKLSVASYFEILNNLNKSLEYHIKNSIRLCICKEAQESNFEDLMALLNFYRKIMCITFYISDYLRSELQD